MLDLSDIFGPRAQVHSDAELERVLALPRRKPATEDEIEALSAWLRKSPDARLRAPQVEALRELIETRGLFGPMRVGSGKTLVTLAAPVVLASRRPVLIVPASLREKTRRDFARYHADWHVRLPRIISYQELGRPDREHLLLECAPDLLMLDEAHHARNLDAAVTRRIKRAIEILRPVVAVLSGTLITDKILDFHHHTVWALGDSAPLPVRQAEAERWAQAIDRDVGMLKRIAPGALERLPGGFFEHFRGSRGVVPTPGSDCEASIQISMWRPKTPDTLRRVIDTTAASGMRPDGELLDEWELPDCLCQLALGFYYVWDPMPPDWWLNPRRGWRAYAKAVLDEHVEGFDSESQITNALDHPSPYPDTEPVMGWVDTHEGWQWLTIGERPTTKPARPQPPAPDEGRELLAAWREVRDKFTPNPVPVWLDASVLAQAAEATNALIWTRYRAAGHMLEKLGVPYYPGGTDPESAKPGQTIALSISAHGTGRNLQAWSRSRVLTPMANADAWEQLIGRTHRAGQKADTVEVEIIGTIDYHGAVLGRVVSEARAITAASGFEHKMVMADWV